MRREKTKPRTFKAFNKRLNASRDVKGSKKDRVKLIQKTISYKENILVLE